MGYKGCRNHGRHRSHRFSSPSEGAAWPTLSQALCSSAVHCSGAGGLAECCRYRHGEREAATSPFPHPCSCEVSRMGMVSRQWLPAGKPHCTPSTVQTRLLAGPAQAPGKFPGSSLTLFRGTRGTQSQGRPAPSSPGQRSQSASGAAACSPHHSSGNPASSLQTGKGARADGLTGACTHP